MKQIGFRFLSCLALLSFLFAATAASAGEPRVVLKGYDPVAYFTDGKPVKGEARYSYDWDDQRFHFASAKHREMFAGDPDRYAPQFSGYCTGSMSRGARNEGNPEAWVIVDNRLFVFGAKDPEAARMAREAALKDPAAFRVKLANAEKNWREKK